MKTYPHIKLPLGRQTKWEFSFISSFHDVTLWSAKEVETRLKKIMDREAKHVFSRSQKLKTDLRRAAFVIALERIEEAMKLK